MAFGVLEGTVIAPVPHQKAAMAAAAAALGHGGDWVTFAEFLRWVFSADTVDFDNSDPAPDTFQVFGDHAEVREVTLIALAPFVAADLTFVENADDLQRIVLTGGAQHYGYATITYPFLDDITLGIVPTLPEGNTP